VEHTIKQRNQTHLGILGRKKYDPSHPLNEVRQLILKLVSPFHKYHFFVAACYSDISTFALCDALQAHITPAEKISITNNQFRHS